MRDTKSVLRSSKFLSFTPTLKKTLPVQQTDNTARQSIPSSTESLTEDNTEQNNKKKEEFDRKCQRLRVIFNLLFPSKSNCPN